MADRETTWAKGGNVWAMKAVMNMLEDEVGEVLV